VYRLVDSVHKDSVLSVLGILTVAGTKNVVKTEICSKEEAYEIAEVMAGDTAHNIRGDLILKHKKIAFISYPHEWCASMLKDSAIFHLDLSAQLLDQGLFLKDAHPWNILFEKGQPIFVDFTSIVSKDALLAEEYLESNNSHKTEDSATRIAFVHKEIFERMYLPYFLAPLNAYAYGKRSWVLEAIEKTTLNASTSIISTRDCLPDLRIGRSTIRSLFGLSRSILSARKILGRLIERVDLSDFFLQMKALVSNLDVAVGSSDYSVYYEEKGEDQENEYSDAWNAKQKAVYNAINVPEISTVLDVACNTGWFAMMSEKLGKHVVAFDIDEGCIENLYSKVKHQHLDILPLVMNFTELTQDRYSIYDGGKVLISAQQRLCSDSVLALGIIHHLVLGLGLSFEEVLDQLMLLCEKQLVIEFVDAEDKMIQNEASFFPAFFKNKDLLSGYDLSNLVAICEERGFDVRCESSYPATRTMLICNKRRSI
jgi:hypothetical protein